MRFDNHRNDDTLTILVELAKKHKEVKKYIAHRHETLLCGNEICPKIHAIPGCIFDRFAHIKTSLFCDIASMIILLFHRIWKNERKTNHEFFFTFART